MNSSTLTLLQESGEDFEWYPTTQRMIAAVAQRIPADAGSIMDIGAGDGRVLAELAKRCDRADLYAIEKSPVLIQAQPEQVTPVGTEFYEQNLACLPVDYIFCNPPYSQFEAWAARIIESGYAKKAFLVIPRRWKESKQIKAVLEKRGASAKVIHSDDFLDAERRARAVVDVVEIRFPMKERSYHDEPQDPFDLWFDQNIDTFDREKELDEDQQRSTEMARLNKLRTIGEMVAAHNEEYARMEANYRAIFQLDYAILKELGVNKKAVRDGIKKKMAGLKTKYWGLLFERLDTITNRLSTKTKSHFLEKLNGRAAIAFTSTNAYAVVLWAIKHANKYYDEQLVQLFRDLSTFEGVLNYKSNQRTWQKHYWRYNAEDHSHYALDYRFIVSRHAAVADSDWDLWEYPGNLNRSCHELIEDVVAVLYNLGFAVDDTPSRHRQWLSGQWQDFRLADDRVLFQAKAHKNGNLHFRFLPAAIRKLNVEAGRLLGWLQNPGDVVKELGYTPEEAQEYYGSSLQINPSNVKLLTSSAEVAA